MDIKRLIKKWSQTAPFAEQTPTQPIQPPVQPIPQQPHEEGIPPVEQNLPDQGRVYSTSLTYWKEVRYYFQIKGVDPTSQDGTLLKNMGYGYKFKTFSKEATPENFESIKQELESISAQTGAVFGQEGIQQLDQAFSSGEMEYDDIEELIAAPISSTEKKEIADEFIRDRIDELAAMTDEAAKQEVIRRFLTLDKRFHNYRFINRILMWMQKPDVSKWVAGKKKWEQPYYNLKRKVREGEQPMEVFAPESNSLMIGVAVKLLNSLRTYRQANMNNPALSNIRDTRIMIQMLRDMGLAYGKAAPYINDYLFHIIFMYGNSNIDDAINAIEKDIEKARGSRYKAIYFGVKQNRWKMVPVYDINQTEPTGPDSFDKPDVQWQSEQNVPDEEAGRILNAALAFSTQVTYQHESEWKTGVDVNLEEEMGETGGWSRGAQIAVNRLSMGWRQLATLVHELAHTILHFGPDRFGTTSQQREIEAESVTYVVLKYYGLEDVAFAANYLALKNATAQNVLDRYNKIHSAAVKITKGIDKNLATHQAHSNWFNTIKIAEIFKRLSMSK